MIMLGRKKGKDRDGAPEEISEVAGSGGSVCILRARFSWLQYLMSRETLALHVDFNVSRVMRHPHSQNSHPFVD